VASCRVLPDRQGLPQLERTVGAQLSISESLQKIGNAFPSPFYVGLIVSDYGDFYRELSGEGIRWWGFWLATCADWHILDAGRKPTGG